MTARDALENLLEEARRRGFLGPGPVREHIAHARAMAHVVEHAVGAPTGPERFCDLGSGGGVPGLVLARRWTHARAVLVESSARRCRALEHWLARLGLEARVQVLEGRGEDVARDPAWRETFPVVVARSFARPSVTAEIGSGLLAPAGVLVVAEPPDAPPGRWPPESLSGLGLGPAEPSEAGERHFVVLAKRSALPERFPRRAGIPAKRPLW